MFKWLLVLPLIAFVDPFLLYWMWPHLNLWVQVGALIVYPLLASLYSRSRPTQEGDIFTRPIRIGARIAAWYPGPISKLLSLLLISAPFERALTRWLTQRFQQHILRGINTGTPRNAPGAPPFTAAPEPGDEKLKRARGRVVE